jgi:hypothetical protein
LFPLGGVCQRGMVCPGDVPARFFGRACFFS